MRKSRLKFPTSLYPWRKALILLLIAGIIWGWILNKQAALKKFDQQNVPITFKYPNYFPISSCIYPESLDTPKLYVINFDDTCYLNASIGRVGIIVVMPVSNIENIEGYLRDQHRISDYESLIPYSIGKIKGFLVQRNLQAEIDEANKYGAIFGVTNESKTYYFYDGGFLMSVDFTNPDYLFETQGISKERVIKDFERLIQSIRMKN